MKGAISDWWPNGAVKSWLAVTLLIVGSRAIHAQTPDAGTPHLRRQGTATQLVVDGAPFLIPGGELGNSSASSLEYLQPSWATLRSLHLNTVLAPVYWELIEPAEGRFSFATVDTLIRDARANNLRLVKPAVHSGGAPEHRVGGSGAVRDRRA